MRRQRRDVRRRTHMSMLSQRPTERAEYSNRKKSGRESFAA
jgi:hypothetical protein